LSPPISTSPELATTVPEQATTSPHIPPQLAPFLPEYSVANGTATLVVTFVDGSTAELNWPEELDMMSVGVYPSGWAYIPHVAARDFFIRQGQVEEVVAQFGPVELLDRYPDGRGGTVGLWRPTDAGGVDYLGFQFGEWAVLVYEYGPGSGSAPMGTEARATWARRLRGETTPDGFLRLGGDEPLRMAIAGDYASPMSMTFESPGGQVQLVPEECRPGFVGDGIGSSEFVHWCDQGGLISVRIVGSAGFQQAVYEGLEIGPVRLGGIEGPDANGSYAHLRDSLSITAERWAAIRQEIRRGEQAGPDAYRLNVSGHIGLMALDFAVVVRNGEPMVESGRPWSASEPPTVETLFGMLEEAITRGDRVSARFHPDSYPAWIRTDGPGVDDEIGLDIFVEMLDG
jgi:hypothetical protein